MLDILIGSLMVALALVAVYWILVFGRPLVRGAKDSRGAVETPPVAFNFDTEKVKVFTPTENFALWCRVYSIPKIVKRPSVNKERIAVSVEELHVYHEGLDITLCECADPVCYAIGSIKGSPSNVRKFLKSMYSEAMNKIIFKEWGL